MSKANTNPITKTLSKGWSVIRRNPVSSIVLLLLTVFLFALALFLSNANEQKPESAPGVGFSDLPALAENSDCAPPQVVYEDKELTERFGELRKQIQLAESLNGRPQRIALRELSKIQRVSERVGEREYLRGVRETRKQCKQDESTREAKWKARAKAEKNRADELHRLLEDTKKPVKWWHWMLGAVVIIALGAIWILKR